MTLEELLDDFKAGVADAEADYPDAPMADLVREVALNIAEFAEPKTRAEFLRRIGLRL
jgi:hypothetical protein